MYSTLTTLQKDLVLAWFKANMTLEQRQELMREMPQIYNALVGQDVVRVEQNPLPAANLNDKRPSARRGRV